MSAVWKAMFLAEHYGRLTLTLDEVSDQIGLAAGTIRNRRMKGEFGWLRATARGLTADVSDVAQYMLDVTEAVRETIALNPGSALPFAEDVQQLCALMEAQEVIPRNSMPAVYCLLCQGEIVYVGQSINLPNRLHQHKQTPIVEWDAWRAIRVPLEHLGDLERALIRRYQPKGNKAGL